MSITAFIGLALMVTGLCGLAYLIGRDLRREISDLRRRVEKLEGNQYDQ